MMVKHRFGDRNDNAGKFVDFYSSHCVVFASTSFEHRAKIDYVSTNRYFASNRIHHFAV